VATPYTRIKKKETSKPKKISVEPKIEESENVIEQRKVSEEKIETGFEDILGFTEAKIETNHDEPNEAELETR